MSRRRPQSIDRSLLLPSPNTEPFFLLPLSAACGAAGIDSNRAPPGVGGKAPSAEDVLESVCALVDPREEDVLDERAAGTSERSTPPVRLTEGGEGEDTEERAVQLTSPVCREAGAGPRESERETHACWRRPSCSRSTRAQTLP